MPKSVKVPGRRQTPKEVEALDGLIGYSLKRAYMIFQDDFRKTVGNSGLTPRAFAVLTLISRLPDVTQSEISRHLRIERSGLVAIVDDLERRGLVLRAPVPGDRRIQALNLTFQGENAYAFAAEAVQQHEDRLLSVLTHDERDLLHNLLSRLRDWESVGP